MGDAIASGFFALGGAAVGGLASFLATAAEARGRERDAAAGRRDALTQTRRTLYSTMLERGDLAADATRRMWSHTRPADIEAEDLAAYLTTWESFVQARASVAIVGPQRVLEAAIEFSRSISDLCNYVDAWMNGARLAPDAEARYMALDEARRKCRRSFIAVVQDVLSTAD